MEFRVGQLIHTDRGIEEIVGEEYGNPITLALGAMGKVAHESRRETPVTERHSGNPSDLAQFGKPALQMITV
jgi:hypothetical protein